ncbi:MAG: hypothetical protein NVS2B17_13070 [Candidatus Velthaea sp.]
MQPSISAHPTPALFMQSVMMDIMKPHALGAAIELGVFGAIGSGAETADRIAERCGCAERGAQMLCDYLTSAGFLHKENACYRLTADSAAFLDRSSPTYIGESAQFLLSPERFQAVGAMTERVRSGGNINPENHLASDHPAWVRFARGMAPLMRPIAAHLAERLDIASLAAPRVLDIAAGHGEFGIAAARANPRAQIVALDWPSVLAVAREHAERAGVLDRMQFLAGSAFDIDFEGPYDIVLFPNFLHHFDRSMNEQLLAKIRRALVPGGTAATTEFVSNEDGVTPPMSAAFALEMLVDTPAGQTYTARELTDMLGQAGFGPPTIEALPGAPFSIVLAT